MKIEKMKESFFFCPIDIGFNLLYIGEEQKRKGFPNIHSKQVLENSSVRG
jgi:hypothetical protein